MRNGHACFTWFVPTHTNLDSIEPMGMKINSTFNFNRYVWKYNNMMHIQKTCKIQALELLVEKVISSAGMPLSPGDCMRRVMEALSTGILINGPGVLDPCEKEPQDALNGLSKQQREDLTVSAQQFIRLIAFRQMYKVKHFSFLEVQILSNRSRSRNQN